MMEKSENNTAVLDFLKEKNLTLNDAGRLLKLINSSKVSFKDYLIEMIGREKAKKIMGMTRREKETAFIIISGRQGPTGKTTLARVLNNHGYRTLELYEHELIELNEELQCQTPQFSMFVE